MHLAHHDARLRVPLPIAVAERGVAEPVGMLLEVLEMAQLERHTDAAQLLVHVDRIGPRAIVARRRRTPVQPLLERRLFERLGDLPRQPGSLRPRRDLRDDAHADAQRAGDLSHRPLKLPTQPQNLSNLSHRRRSVAIAGPPQRPPLHRAGCPRHSSAAVFTTSNLCVHVTDPSVHDAPISVFTMDRFERSRCSDFRNKCREQRDRA